jgi:hypothetical protein
MMKKFLLFVFLSFFFFNYCEGQNPLVKIWDKRFGGMYDDRLFSFQQTKDGGYILGGFSNSPISGDKTQANWDTTSVHDNFWVVKIDSLGTKQWDKRFGGTGGEYLYALQQTLDGGYILGGNSHSDISGDKTQDNWDVTHSTSDYWIVKTDSLGIKQWDKRFGGTHGDYLYSLQQTNDGGFILGGLSFSDSSGDKTQPNWGSSDYWIVKTDSLGIKQWDKRFGGTDEDDLSSVLQTSDGGYILGGTSSSEGNGDKSQSMWDYPCTQCYKGDFWVVKLDWLGVKQWDKQYGGVKYDALRSLKEIKGGYILGGISRSGISGDKTQPLRDTCLNCQPSDFWIVKIDYAGNLLWDKDFGGAKVEDEFGSIALTNDSGYLLAGTSYSGISGDKTEDNLGHEQTWIIKTDSLGVKQWDKTVFTNTGAGDDEQGLAIQTKEGCYVFANYTWAGIGGYKTQPNWGSPNNWDYWIVKFCDSSLVSTNVNQLSFVNSTFSIYPNPFTNELVIKSQVSGSREIILFDVAGKEILRQKTTEAETKLNTEGIAAGFYLLRVGGENFKVVKAQ